MGNYTLGKQSVIINVDASLYSKETTLAAAYAMLGKAHIIVGKAEGENGRYVIKLTPLEGKPTPKNLEELAKEYNDQLVNYAMFYQESAKNDELRKVLIATALYGVQKSGK
ncbi:MAG: hypothetical protein HY811_00170 [Planctomycetes bacterium]|nr:hypothetical protein [Planctomycetota bacterium]